jgi:hypothetical protein
MVGRGNDPMSVLRIDSDPGLLTNRRMSIEIGVALAALSGRRLSMPWSDPVGHAPGARPSKTVTRAPSAPLISDLWEVPGDIVTDDEWRDHGGAAHTVEWGPYSNCVYLGDDQPIPSEHLRDFAHGRTRFVRVPDIDGDVHVVGRPLVFYSYFIHASGERRRTMLEALDGVRVRQEYIDLASVISSEIGSYNVAHIRRSDLVLGIPAYADVTPAAIAEDLAANLPTDVPLVIATEDEPGSELFDPLRERFRDLVFLDQVILGDHRDAFAALPAHEDNALGIVTQEIALAAGRFFGTFGSTFTAYIHRERCRRDPTSSFEFTYDYSPPGPTFRNGRFVEANEGRYSWNRVGLAVSADVNGWLREWPEAVRSPDDQVDETGPQSRDRRAEPIHTLVCTDTNPYGDWQFELLEHTWRRAGQPGELVRLVACPNGETPAPSDVARVVTTTATNSHERAPKDYAGFNRLWSLHEWLTLEQPTGSILILDCDMVFRASARFTAEPGEIVAQEWHDFAFNDSLVARVAPFVDAPAERIEPLTWPMVFAAGDLSRLMPRWIELCADFRAETGMWESDMFALVAAVAETDLRVRYETTTAWMNWPEDYVAGAPLIHYCQQVLGRDGSVMWGKQSYAPWEPLGVDPNDAELDYCRDLLHLIDDFISVRARSRSRRA